MKKPQKDKEQDNKPKKEQKKKLKIIIEKNPLKSKINQIDNTEPKKYNRNIMTHNSISTKEEIKKKLSPSRLRNKQNNKLNLLSNNTYKSNKLLSSNHLFLTCEANSQSNLDDKKIIKKNKKLKNYSNGGERITSKEISTAFKKDKFKKTIIIDDEGNNNLNLNIDKNHDYDYKNILNNNNNTIISNSFSGNTETNSLFMSSNKSNIENYNSKNYNRNSKENDIKQTIIDKNEEERRLIEYRKIFNLLNSNIEQFKKMFANKDINDNNNLNNSKKNKKIVIHNKKDSNTKKNNKNRNNSLDKYKNNDKSKNIKKNLSEKNLSTKNKYNKSNNQSIFSPKKNVNNNFDINNNYSFLESSIQDDFYQSLINQTFLQNVSRTSFEMNIDDISNIPAEKVICDEEKKSNDKDLKMDTTKNIKNLEDKPLEEENKKKVKQKSSEKTSKDEKNYKNLINEFDKNNCLIF